MFKGGRCSELTQDQKFVLENVLPSRSLFLKFLLMFVSKPSEAYKYLDDFFAQSSTTFNKDKADRLYTDAVQGSQQ